MRRQKEKVTCHGYDFEYGKRCPKCGSFGSPIKKEAPKRKAHKSEFRVFPRTQDFLWNALLLICGTIVVITLILALAARGG